MLQKSLLVSSLPPSPAIFNLCALLIIICICNDGDIFKFNPVFKR